MSTAIIPPDRMDDTAIGARPARAGARRQGAPAAAKAAPAIDDPFGLLGSLDLGALAAGWAGQPAHLGWGHALASSGLATAVVAPPGLYASADGPAAADESAAAEGPTEISDPARQHLLAEDEACSQCGGQMRRGANDLEYICGDCGLVVEGDTAEPEDDDAPRPAPNTARLRIVGPNSNQLQPDLYRSGAGNTAATQKKQILEEYRIYRQLYIEAGGRAFPLNACELAAEYYNAVQRQCVKRSQNKKAIMAACLWRACVAIGFAPTKSEIAAFMQLPNKGIARGDNFVRSLVADGKMDIEANADPSRAEIVTLFAHLAYDGDQYAGLREAVYDVVQTAIKNNIGTSSILRSKVAGASYVVLRRCKDRGLVPRPMSLQEFCQNRIRKNTVERFTRQLDAYHSYFEDCYKRAGLDASPPR